MTVRGFAAEKKEVVRYRFAIDSSLQLAFKRIRLSASFFGIAFFAAFAAADFVFWKGARMMAASELSPGALLTFLFNTMQMAFSMAALAELWTDVQKSAGAAERVFDLLHRKAQIPSTQGRQLPSVQFLFASA